MSSLLFDLALNADANANNGLTTVERFEVAALTIPVSGIVGIRCRFEAGSTEGLTINTAYIGHAAGSGDAYDFLATPVQLFFGGSAGVILSAGQASLTDWATFSYNKTSALLVAFYTNGGTGSDMFRYKTGVANTAYYFKSANDPATVNKTGYSTTAQLVAAINRIEVRTPSGFFMLF